eukprot:TRINITY_DN28410_c0_g1_i2.p2 TRINITY_DN28410_c0_g1~~TRINITY_DN28410_c0_g1_i2.p2  ORF type:complete len:109 (-),score=8.17 TRINITY_DN28410_c0_g1_i2:18-344(-)
MMQSLGFFITLAKSHNLLSYNCITLQISKESKEDTLKISNIFNLSCSCLQCINICLLYTSDAADDMQCVDLGGRRVFKKKTWIIQSTCNELFKIIFTTRQAMYTMTSQ